jgi:hypothetical protein
MHVLGDVSVINVSIYTSSKVCFRDFYLTFTLVIILSDVNIFKGTYFGGCNMSEK